MASLGYTILIDQNDCIAECGACKRCFILSTTCSNSSSDINIGFNLPNLTRQIAGTGACKIAIGYRAGYANSGAGQIAIGNFALFSNTGSFNVAIGYGAMGIGTGAGCHNTAIGYFASPRITSGTCNVSVGFRSLYCISSGSRNVAIGGISSCSATTMNNSVAIGQCSKSGGNNGTAIGHGSQAVSYGSLAIGFLSYANGLDAIAIGYGSVASAGTLLWGGPFNTTANCAWSSWNYLSDYRDKSDIVNIDDDLGLNFIRKLRPVKYRIDNRKKYVYKCGFEFGCKDGTLIDMKREHYGLIAQEVEEIIEELNVEFDGLSYNNIEDKYQIIYSEIIPSVVKTIQQIDQRIDILKNKLI